MKLEFVNHAGFIVETGDIVLLCDPWLEAPAFNGGWKLLAPTVLSPESIDRVTHLWFSHEHPDHFSPADLKRIPAEVRAKITVLFQATVDRKVARFCESMGFREVRELEPRTWYPLEPGVEILCNPLPTEWDADSWMCLRDGTHTLLNINDCGVEEESVAHDIREQVGPVDVLMTQFSYAAWTGNPDDVESRRAVARGILDNIALQTRILEPRHVIPFASFIWFSSPTGYYLNRDGNRIDEVADFVRNETGAEPVVLYPGDRWTLGEPHDSRASIERYLRDRERIPPAEDLPAPPTVEEPALLEASEQYISRLNEAVSPLLVRLDQAASAGRDLGPLSRLRELFRRPEAGLIHVEDLDRCYAFDAVRGLCPIDVEPAECHIRTGSDSLHYALRFLWGGETLQVNGRFVEQRPEGVDALGVTADHVFRQFRLGRGLDLGRDLSWGAVMRAAGRRLHALFPGYEVRT